MIFTKQKFMAFYPDSKPASDCFDAVALALAECGILTELTLLGALATVRVEVGRTFQPIEEHADGKAYEGRKDLGNTKPGDGPRFKGRGYIQLTGRSNYTNYGKVLGLDLVNHPELCMETRNSAKILAQYFKDRKVNVACDAKDWVKVRKLVNGGSNGLNVFLSVINQYTA